MSSVDERYAARTELLSYADVGRPPDSNKTMFLDMIRCELRTYYASTKYVHADLG